MRLNNVKSERWTGHWRVGMDRTLESRGFGNDLLKSGKGGMNYFRVRDEKDSGEWDRRIKARE